MALSCVPSGIGAIGKQPTTQRNTTMEWTSTHDVALCLEVLVTNPFQAKKKTTQRAQLWQSICDNLKGLDSPKYKTLLTKRSVQDRSTLLCDKYKRTMAQEKRDSGISPKVTELDQLLEEIIEKEKLSEERKDEGDALKKKKIEEEKTKAMDMRKKALERACETKKRKASAAWYDDDDDDDDDVKIIKRKSRKTGSDTVEFLKQNHEKEMEMREKELELKREGQSQQDSIVQLLLKQQQQHQQQQQQQQQQMQQQQQQMQMVMQQQSNAMLSLLEKLAKS